MFPKINDLICFGAQRPWRNEKVKKKEEKSLMYLLAIHIKHDIFACEF